MSVMLDRVFSDRRRASKAGAALGLAAILAVGFHLTAGRRLPTFTDLAIHALPSHPPIRTGPEHVRVKSVEPWGISAEKYGMELALSFPGGPARERARQAAESLKPGDYVRVIADHLGGAQFEIVELQPNPLRRLKLMVSGAAAVLVVALLPVYFHWSRGALRRRRP